MQIQTTNKISAKDGVKCVVYGASSVGKTRLAITAPAPFIMSAEKGLLSLKKENIPYHDVSGYKELIESYNWVMKSAEARHVGTLILDSCSEIAEVILGEEKRRNKDGRKAYGNMQDQMMELLRNFRDIPHKNVVVICKQIIVDVGEVKKCVPLMPSQTLLAQLPYFWDEVLHMYTGLTTDGRSYGAFHTKDSPYWTAKDRSGNLDEIERPDLAYVFKKVIS